MNGTIISEVKIEKMKNLSQEIQKIETEIICFGSDSKLEYKQRKLTEQLTEIIKTL